MTEFETFIQRFSVPFDYPVHFARDIFDAGNPLLADVIDRRREGRRHRCLVCIDSGAAGVSGATGVSPVAASGNGNRVSDPAAAAGQRPAAHSASGTPAPRQTLVAPLVARVKRYFHEHPAVLELAGEPVVIPGGETAKTGWEPVRDLMWTLGNLHLDRQSFVLAVGGGSVLDMVGFGTSIVHRGLRLVRVPTTTLAQADAGIGVKNAMDEHGQKNFVGTFAPPFAVINDFAFLPALPREHWVGGVAEAFKVAIIKDAAFLDDLCRNASALRNRDLRAMESVVYRTAVLHLEHIRDGGDPFELGSARPLDFGHWAAHKLEAMTNFAVGHGQAVSIGIAIDCLYAVSRKLLGEADCRRILAAMAKCGLSLWHDALEQRTPDGRLTVLEGLDQFREHLGGVLTVTLPNGVGRKVEVHQMDARPIEDAIRQLKDVGQ